MYNTYVSHSRFDAIILQQYPVGFFGRPFFSNLSEKPEKHQRKIFQKEIQKQNPLFYIYLKRLQNNLENKFSKIKFPKKSKLQHNVVKGVYLSD